MADANWLLSSTAQSAAALVAIVGAFLISRTLHLAALREERRNSADLLDTRATTLQGQAADLREVGTARGVQIEARRILGEIASERGNLDLEKHAEEADIPDEMRPQLLERLKEGKGKF